MVPLLMCLLRLMQDEILDIRLRAAEVYCQNKLMQESVVHPSICVEQVVDELVSHSKLSLETPGKRCWQTPQQAGGIRGHIQRTSRISVLANAFQFGAR